MNPYDLLSDEIQQFIYQKGWSRFTRIQKAAIPKIISTKNNYILSSKTASGKTDAVFLPITSLIPSFEYGIKVLYISPTIALINDQFKRLNELCEFLNIKITKWHSDASYYKKKKISKNPSGIILITPESIESQFINHPDILKKLYIDLEFIIIDEIHIFIGSDRGLQLKSLLFRLKKYIKNEVRLMGLSATLGSPEKAKNFFGDYQKTKVLIDRSKKQKKITINSYKYKNHDRILPKKLILDVFKKTYNRKTLIFTNTRARSEYLSVKLRHLNKANNCYQNYFSHHSSVSKEIREYIEQFAKNVRQENFGICCTSTLELGIDIGSVDLIVQIDSTFSVSSLLQRIGRSGRTENARGYLDIYCTSIWNFLQSLAIITLIIDGFIDSHYKRRFPIDICFHQILSLLKERFGIEKDKLIPLLKSNYVFKNIKNKDIIKLIEYMVQIGYIECVSNQFIFGLKSEKFLKSGEIYSMFDKPEDFKVLYRGMDIGLFSVFDISRLRSGMNIYLAAKIWELIEINLDKKTIYVKPAKKGEPPVFAGKGVDINNEIRRKMLEIIFSEVSFPDLDERSKMFLSEIKDIFKFININNLDKQRPVLIKKNKILFFTFVSTKINRTLDVIFDNILSCKVVLYDYKSLFVIHTNNLDFDQLKSDIIKSLINFEQLLKNNSKLNYYITDHSKWGNYLPIELSIKMLITDYFDIEGTNVFVKNLRIITKFSKN